MQDSEKRDDENSNRELAQSVKNDTADSSTANPDPSQSIQQADSEKPSAGKKDSSILAHNTSGPRTAAGKKRSSRNALKSGIFSSAMFLGGEVAAEYRVILDGLLKDWQPVGMLERILVDQLATVIWRRRRLLMADSAEIENARLLNTIDSALVLEAWDRSRAGETSGGMLRHTSNPVVIEEAIVTLTLFRDDLEKFGFQKDDDLWPLRKLYGLDHDGEAPTGIFHAYKVFAMLAENISGESEKDRSREELKKSMVELINIEIVNLKNKQNLSRPLAERREYYQSIAVSIPQQGVMERIVHYEAHLSREFDRILNRLERLQGIRRGQPVPPSIKLELERS